MSKIEELTGCLVSILAIVMYAACTPRFSRSSPAPPFWRPRRRPPIARHGLPWWPGVLVFSPCLSGRGLTISFRLPTFPRGPWLICHISYHGPDSDRD